MRHRKIESLIVLDFYNEASPEEKAKLGKHLQSCPKCSKFQQDLFKSIPLRGQADDSLTEKTLIEARTEFHRTLVSEKNVPEYKLRPQASGLLPVPVFVVAVIALLMLAVGSTVGYIFASRPSGSPESVISELTSLNRGSVAIDNIQFVSTDKKSGQVQFSFDFVKRYDMSGSLDDRDVQKVLAYALGNSDNAGVRLRSVGMLDAAASAKPDEGIELALIKAARTDENSGVRREALLSLKKLPFDNSIKDALLFILQNDKNPGMRVLAINYLSEKEIPSASPNRRKIDPKILNVLKEKSSSDQNQYVRIKAAGMLKEITEL